MKIEGGYRPMGELSAVAPRQQTQSAPAESSPEGASAPFNLELRLAAAERVLANQPVVDSTRVETLKKAVAEGRYTVNAERLADRLLQNEQLRLASTRSATPSTAALAAYGSANGLRG